MSGDPVLDALLLDYPEDMRSDPELQAFVKASVAYDMASLRKQAEDLGAGHLVDQIDTLKRDIGERRDEALRRWWNDPR